MPLAPAQILTVRQMRGAEAALIARGVGSDALMRRAGRGAADYVWRAAAGRAVTVLCGPGNNGGDGYVLAEALRARGGTVRLIAAAAPASDAARHAAQQFSGEVFTADGAADVAADGSVLVDCLFGSGLSRPLSASDAALLASLAGRHTLRIALDLPSGVDADSGAARNPGLPDYHLTLALGAWKPAHALMPAVAMMGALRLVDIGIAAVPGAGRMLRRPQGIAAPAADAHKYSRGVLGVVAGAMAGAACLAARAAQGAGAGYVKLVSQRPLATPFDLVVDPAVLSDPRLAAVLIGSGLGRDAAVSKLLVEALEIGFSRGVPLVLDADALRLLTPKMLAPPPAMLPQRLGPIIATPHAGEFAALEKAFGCVAGGSKIDRAVALARASAMTIVAKGPDTIIAAPNGRWVAAPLATTWLSTAGTGDVLAGCIASRLATGATPLAAAAQGLWLQAEAARQAGPAFAAGALADAVRLALAACL